MSVVTRGWLPGRAAQISPSIGVGVELEVVHEWKHYNCVGFSSVLPGQDVGF